MTSKEIFNQYFKRKLLIWGGVGIGAILIRLLSGHETSFTLTAIFILIILTAVFIIGYTDYRFYEKAAPVIIAKLLDKTPLIDFQNIGFSKEDGDKLEGEINNYKIILSPATNIGGDKALIVLIPLQIRQGLEHYFTKYNDTFRFSLSDEMILAEAILKNYEKEYDYKKLFSLIDTTTVSLKENDIKPLQ